MSQNASDYPAGAYTAEDDGDGGTRYVPIIPESGQSLGAGSVEFWNELDANMGFNIPAAGGEVQSLGDAPFDLRVVSVVYTPYASNESNELACQFSKGHHDDETHSLIASVYASPIEAGVPINVPVLDDVTIYGPFAADPTNFEISEGTPMEFLPIYNDDPGGTLRIGYRLIRPHGETIAP